MNGTVETAEQVEAEAAAGDLPKVAELRLPGWYFAFEGTVAGIFDLLRAFPSAWPAVVVLVAANIAVSLTVMRGRLRLAKLLWRGKGTRTIMLTLVGIRIGAHLLLAAIGLAAGSATTHVLFALAMSALSVGLMLHTQRTSLAALVASGKATA
ncbi:hypothetical protein [Kitasatospora cinereorecta]|uniref:Uncharacterized protein n=1 Tax=Kitasatospora cinereorecta TaxID=285560 RepID=A0ABW0V4B9_9ACTN